jgi:hypothetical protein
MLATTDGGDSYTKNEMRGMLERSGFRVLEFAEIEGMGVQVALASA